MGSAQTRYRHVHLGQVQPIRILAGLAVSDSGQGASGNRERQQWPCHSRVAAEQWGRLALLLREGGELAASMERARPAILQRQLIGTSSRIWPRDALVGYERPLGLSQWRSTQVRDRPRGYARRYDNGRVRASLSSGGCMDKRLTDNRRRRLGKAAAAPEQRSRHLLCGLERFELAVCPSDHFDATGS
jgi:hypothetical protein